MPDSPDSERSMCFRCKRPNAPVVSTGALPVSGAGRTALTPQTFALGNPAAGECGGGVDCYAFALQDARQRCEAIDRRADRAEGERDALREQVAALTAKTAKWVVESAASMEEAVAKINDAEARAEKAEADAAHSARLCIAENLQREVEHKRANAAEARAEALRAACETARDAAQNVSDEAFCGCGRCKPCVAAGGATEVVELLDAALAGGAVPR